MGLELQNSCELPHGFKVWSPEEQRVFLTVEASLKPPHAASCNTSVHSYWESHATLTCVYCPVSLRLP